jgi:putative transposase
MARFARLVAPGYPHHVTQRGNDGRVLFHSGFDYHLYLKLLRGYAQDYGVEFLGYCLMPDHVHWIAVPEAPDSLSRTVARVHREYARHHHRIRGGSGHLWETRFDSCVLDDKHGWQALACIERNPVRAQLCLRAEDYAFSSARAHAEKGPTDLPLDTREWVARFNAELWREVLRGARNEVPFLERFRRATQTGRPLADDRAIEELEWRLGRRIRRRTAARPRALVQQM